MEEKKKLRTYGGCLSKRVEDITKCVETVIPDGNWYGHQCNRPRVIGEYCKQHAPAAVAARRKASDDRWRAEMKQREDAAQRINDDARDEVLREVYAAMLNKSCLCGELVRGMMKRPDKDAE